MRAQTPLALLAIILGALETAGAVQELVFRGVLQSLTGPLCIGAIGTVGGVFVLATGIALLLRSRRVDILIPTTAWLSVPSSSPVSSTIMRAGHHRCWHRFPALTRPAPLQFSQALPAICLIAPELPLCVASRIA